MSIAYAFHRSTGGNIVVFVPNYTATGTDVRPNIYSNFSSAINTLSGFGFDGTESLLVNGNDQKGAALAWGAPSEKIIDMSQYIGETWTISNGNYLTISQDPDNLNITVSLYRADQSLMYILTCWSGTTQHEIFPIYFHSFYNGGMRTTAFFLDSLALWRFGLSGSYVGATLYPVTGSSDDFFDGVPGVDTEDPYWAGGDSTENSGGDGTFDDSSDNILDSTLPTVSAANTGFTRIYNPTLAQVQALANYLWTDATLPQTLWNHIKQFLENPMDAFIAFNLVPCAVPDGGTVEFKVMYIGTGVNITAAASQFVDVDCGYIAIGKYYDSALDYSPYTKISIFLPFIGSVQLDTDDVMGKTISVKYRIDIVSGGCVAKIFVDGSIHYQYSGHCAITIPFTSADFTGYISAMIQTAKAVTSIAAGAAGNTALAASMAGMPEQRTGKSTKTTTVSLRNPNTGRMRREGSTTVERESVSGTEASFGSILANNFTNTVGTVMGSKAIVDRSGAFSGNTGYLGVRRPFVIIERPRMCNPAEYGKYNGRPSMLTLTLGDCTGFTQVQQVQLTGFSATNPELDEIGALLKSGVIL